MKILFLGEPSSPNTMSWVEGLREQGCKVVIASVRSDGSDGNIPIGNPNIPPRLRILTGVGHLKGIIAEVKPDILLAYRITSYGYLAAKTGFHPLVLAAQNEQIVYLPKPSFLRRKFLEKCVRYAVKNADLMHAWGNNIAQGLMKFGADENKILILHRGIDMEMFSSITSNQSSVIGEENKSKITDSPTHRLTGSPTHRFPVFLSTRSLYPEYLIDKILNAFSMVIKTIPEAKLEIAGSGTEEKILKRKVQQLGLGKNVTFHGKLNQKQLVYLLKTSEIYLSIIETEGISSSLIESIACQLLPIVADMPASREMIKDKVNGFLIKKITPEFLCNVMLGAVGKYSDLQPALNENSETVKQKFSREINQKVFVGKYNDLLGK